jgi:hypothetical protein
MRAERRDVLRVDQEKFLAIARVIDAMSSCGTLKVPRGSMRRIGNKSLSSGVSRKQCRAACFRSFINSGEDL